MEQETVVSEETVEEQTKLEEQEENEIIEESEQTPEEDEEVESSEDDEVASVTFGDEETPPQEEVQEEETPSWVKELRQKQKDMSRENRELKEKLKQYEQPQQQVQQIQLGAKPTLESSDYDEELYEKNLDEWYANKRKYDEQQAKQQEAQQQQQEQWNKTIKSYEESKALFKAKDFQDAEDNVVEVLNEVQQGIILANAENPTALVYGIGKNESKLKELAQEKDPLKFVYKMAKLEATMKVNNKSQKPKSAPEKKLGGVGAVSGVTSTALEKAREKAAKTNDYTEVNRLKKQLRNK